MSDIEKEASEQPILAVEVDERRDDLAAKFMAEIAALPNADELLADATPEESKRLLAKVDAIIISLSLVALMMGATDKIALGSTSVMGIIADLHLVGQDYSWANSIIFFGAIVAVGPSLLLMQRLPTARYVSFNVTVWGIIGMCLAACQSAGALLGLRFLLGLFESINFAGFGLIVAMWFTRQEQPFRTAMIFSTLSSVMNALLALAAYNYHGHTIAQWRLLFVIAGAITVAWSILLWTCLPANPTRAWWLTTRQKVLAVRRMQTNHTGMENKTFKAEQMWEAVYDPKTWFYFFINISLNIPNGGLSGFNSLLIKGMGFDTQNTLLLAMPTGIVSWLSSLVWGYVAVKSKQRALSAIGSVILPLIGVILLVVVPRSNQGGSLLGVYLAAMYWGSYIVVMGIMYANTGGYTKKMTVYAVAYIGYCVGNIIGPQTFRTNQAPRYLGGAVAMIVCHSATICMMFGYFVYIRRLSRRKTEAADENPSDELLQDLHDETDLKNPYFTYVV